MRRARTMTGLTTVALLLLCCGAVQVSGSAIPMWEFLSRDEKMSHLYRLFSKQVARYCVDSSRPDCNKNLLVTGVRNLAAMDDNVLDKLDPYQHGATEIIWRAMVGTNRFASRVGYETDDSYYTTGPDPLANGDSDSNGLVDEPATSNDYVRPSAKHTGPYLVGPMVIRVFPDGRPVPEDSTRPLPKDEDAEELKYSRLPSIEEIEANSSSPFYGKPSDNDDTKRHFFGNKNHQRRMVAPFTEPTHRQGGSPLPYERRHVPQIATNERTIRYY